MIHYVYFGVLPFKVGDVIYRGYKGKIELIISSKNTDGNTTLTLVTLSKCKIVRYFQKKYYLIKHKI